jgi:rhodanese-related sulfurtransferase
MKYTKLIIIVFITIVMIGTGWFVSQKTDKPKEEEKLQYNYKNIGPHELSSMLQKKDFVLIDTHIPEQAHIAGTDAFIPYDEIDKRVSEFPKDKNIKIVLYCRSGSMSEIASEKLLELGYTNVYNLLGGINSWKQAGYNVDDVQ